MGNTNYSWLIPMLIASPILLIVLVVFGVLQLAIIIGTLFNIWLWLIIVFFILLVRVERWMLWGVIIGFGYWAFTVWSVLANFAWWCNLFIVGPLSCGIYTTIRIFDLVGVVLATIIMSGILVLVREEVFKR